MPLIRTNFRPWEQVDVPDEEAAALARQGLLAPEPPDTAPEPETSPEQPAEQATKPAAKPRRGKSTDTTTAAAEGVNTDGSSEEVGQAEEG